MTEDTTKCYASKPEKSRGRLEKEKRENGYRSIFASDRDRIIHSTAFRRLMHKTQVFVAWEGDHYRTRLTHTLEVAQIARTLAVALGFNVDLTEAIALSHDLGHPPFGHKGEDVLNPLMADYGGFDHNAQAIKIVTELENRYADFNGLNLSWETLEGMAKHNGPLCGPFVDKEKKKPISYILTDYNKKKDLELGSFASGEAQIAAIADDIAYNHHDLDDGLRARLFSLKDIEELPLIADALQKVDAKYPSLPPQKRQFEMLRFLIKAMVNNVIETAEERLANPKLCKADDLRGFKSQVIGLSPVFAEDLEKVHIFLKEKMYKHEEIMEKRKQYAIIVKRLFLVFANEEMPLPHDWQKREVSVENGIDKETLRMREISDYLSGMTDNFAKNLYDKICG